MAAVVVGYCWSLLFGLRKTDDSDVQLNELLLQEFVAEQPKLLPPPKQRLIAKEDPGADGSVAAGPAD